MRSGPTSTPLFTRFSRLYCAALTLTDFLYLAQAGDLKRLLELYIGWQQRILPFSTFDAFLEALEKLGSSYVLKVMHMCTQHGHWPLMLQPSKPTKGLSASKLLASADGATRIAVRCVESPGRIKAGKLCSSPSAPGLPAQQQLTNAACSEHL